MRRNDCPTMVDSEPVTAQSLYTGETVLWGDGDEAVPVTVDHADAESGLVSVRHCYPIGDQGKRNPHGSTTAHGAPCTHSTPSTTRRHTALHGATPHGTWRYTMPHEAFFLRQRKKTIGAKKNYQRKKMVRINLMNSRYVGGGAGHSLASSATNIKGFHQIGPNRAPARKSLIN